MNKIITFKGYQSHQPGIKIPAAELLRWYRTRSKLTQFELAQRIGLKSDRVVRRWENGQSLPEASRLKKLIEVYITGKFFTRFEEEAEAYTLWEAVKETFELQSGSFETYTIFDASWFAELTGKVYPGQVIRFPADKLLPANDFNSISGTSNFPATRDSFIGREEQAAQIKDMLAVSRLLTITGPPGVGKTRLALEVSPTLANWFRDGILLVRLEPLASPAPEALPQAIGRILGLDGTVSVSRQLLTFFQGKRILLVLDLFDTFVAEGSRFIDQLLKGCEDVNVLVTSREKLEIKEEKIIQLDPLEVAGNLPVSQATLELAGFPAGVRLFTGRALAVQTDFEFNARSASVIARICQQLDGLPLAIELAASLVEVLALEQIEARLSNPFDLLKRTGSNRGQADYPQSLSNSFELSFSRLSGEERLSLQTFASLKGNFDLKTAEQRLVAGGLPRERGVALVRALVRKSLVQSQNVNGITTFSLLNTVKSYCRYLEKQGDYFGKGK